MLQNSDDSVLHCNDILSVIVFASLSVEVVEISRDSNSSQTVNVVTEDLSEIK